MAQRTAIVAGIAALTIALVSWIGIRLIVAERSSEPSYILRAGNDYIQKEWGFSSRFDNETKDTTGISSALNSLNASLFRMSRPIFWLENKVIGKRIGRNDAGYSLYMRRVAEVRSAWDYVISSRLDGGALYAVKNNSIVQKVE
jgi:hypothetical protein